MSYNLRDQAKEALERSESICCHHEDDRRETRMMRDTLTRWLEDGPSVRIHTVNKAIHWLMGIQ